jgi:hypothetical protein
MTSSRRARRLSIRAGCILLGVASATPAFAQRSAADIETARQLYNQGIELRDHGDLRGALEKLRAAHALGNTPITGLELCKTHASMAQPVEAREVCLGVGRIPPLSGETSRSQDARNEAARVAEDMRPKISIVRLHIMGVPPGREPIVTVDGAPVPLAALGEARAVNPGKHEVSARIGNGPETRSQIDLAPGESKDVSLPVTAPPPEAEPVHPPPQGGERPPPRERSNGLQTAGLVIGGIGVGIGAISGIVALSEKSDLDKKCTDKICGVPDHDALDSAKRWGNVSTAFFIVGGVGALIALYATVNPPRPRASTAAAQKATFTPDFGPGGMGIHGAF